MQQQFAALSQALSKAGLRAEAAAEIAYILANPAQEVRSGPTSVDTTPRNMRLVTPDARKHSLRNLDFRDADPDYRQQRIPSSEQRDPPQPPSAIVEQRAPQQTESKFNVTSGDFADARSVGDAVQVGFRVQGPDQSVATIDSTGNSLIGKPVRAETDASGLRFFVQDTGQELVWKLQSTGTGPVGGLEVVTGVRLSAAGLEITKQRVTVLAAGDESTDLIPVQSC